MAALGLDENVYGLEFYDLAVERAFDGPTPILLVSGEVRNIGRDDKAVPPVRISLRDAQSREIYEVVTSVGEAPLGAGGAAPFQIRVENPPADAVDLEATFASLAEAASADAPHVAPVISAPEAHEEPLELTHPVADEHAEGFEPQALSYEGQVNDGLAPRFAAEGHG
jgi:hypothetical protein